MGLAWRFMGGFNYVCLRKPNEDSRFRVWGGNLLRILMPWVHSTSRGCSIFSPGRGLVRRHREANWG